MARFSQRVPGVYDGPECIQVTRVGGPGELVSLQSHALTTAAHRPSVALKTAHTHTHTHTLDGGAQSSNGPHLLCQSNGPHLLPIFPRPLASTPTGERELRHPPQDLQPQVGAPGLAIYADETETQSTTGITNRLYEPASRRFLVPAFRAGPGAKSLNVVAVLPPT